jgi:Outer membrane protein beta-barrel domain
MKKFALIALAALIVCSITATAFAKSAGSSSSQNVEVDGSLVLASAPASGFDTGFGVTFGFGMMLPQINKDLQGRIELSYVEWSATELGVDVTYKRVPVDIGGRFYLPTQSGNLKVFVQGMLEVSFDRVEVSNFPFSGTASESETHLGLVPGGGIELKINPSLSFIADARWHLITDDYVTLQAGLAYHF